MHITTVWGAYLDFKMIIYIVWRVHKCWHGGNRHQFENGPENNATNTQNMGSFFPKSTNYDQFSCHFIHPTSVQGKIATLPFFSHVLTTRTTSIVPTIHKGLLNHRRVRHVTKIT